MNNYHPTCAVDGKPCGLIDQPGARNMGDHWLCKPHYDEQKFREMQKRREYLSTGNIID